MNRTLLLSLQILVALVILVLWHLATNTGLFGNPKTISFFFADPLKVAHPDARAKPATLWR